MLKGILTGNDRTCERTYSINLRRHHGLLRMAMSIHLRETPIAIEALLRLRIHNRLTMATLRRSKRSVSIVERILHRELLVEASHA